MRCLCCDGVFVCWGLEPEDNDRLEQKWLQEHQQRVREHHIIWNIAFPNDPVTLPECLL